LSKIVNGGKTTTHIVKPYKFVELKESEGDSEFTPFEATSQPRQSAAAQPEEEKPQQPSPYEKEIIENLLKKIEELSQMVGNQPDSGECEQKLQQCFNQLSEEKKNAFEEGYKKAIEELKAKYDEEVRTLRSLFEDSIKKVGELNKIFEEKLSSIEKDLISVALDIAYEVIQKEVSENSKDVAKALADSVMQELKNAKKVTIKVNPKDAEALKDVKGVEVVPDEAVKEGGIVIISDVGNIDAEIEERFKNVKEAILNARSG